MASRPLGVLTWSTLRQLKSANELKLADLPFKIYHSHTVTGQHNLPDTIHKAV